MAPGNTGITVFLRQSDIAGISVPRLKKIPVELTTGNIFLVVF